MVGTQITILVVCFVILLVSVVTMVRLLKGRKRIDLQIQKLIQQKDELLGLLEFDEMTTAKSRQYLSMKVDKKPRKGPVGLIYIDMDRFTSVNDGHGALTGDDLLMAVAAQIENILTPPDFVARVAGDEFCVISYTDDPDQIKELADEITATISQTSVRSGELNVSRSASLGACLLEPAQKLIDGLIIADSALRRAKALGGNRAHMADDCLLRNMAAIKAKPTIEALQSGLEKGEVIYHVQPIFNLTTQVVAGAEALIRWRTPSGTILSPSVFLDTMTTNYHITLKPPLEAANRAGQLMASVHPQMFCSFNISASFLEQAEKINAAWIDRLLAGLPPHQIVFEIVENAVIADPKGASKVIGSLREAGVRVALDDFGTGESNLSRLKDYPVDIVKIDRQFVHMAEADYRNTGILLGLVEMSRALGFDIIAEGIETQQQLDAVRNLGIDLAQGYYLGRPDSPEIWHQRLCEDPNLSPEYIKDPTTAEG